MKKQNKYPIRNFYIGEIYLYTSFGNILAGELSNHGKEKIDAFMHAGAINFQGDLISRYIDWENRREYIGFLTIFYKEGNNYICLHDGKTYQLGMPIIIDNLISLESLLPKLDIKKITEISMYDGLELFDILFKETENKLYIGQEQKISDFYVGDIALRTRTPIETNEQRIHYIQLPQRLMLEKSGLDIYSFGKGNYANTVYRCLFLKDGVDLYNINDNEFYNPNEDSFESLIPLKEYMDELEIRTPAKTTTIPKELKRFIKTM